MKRGSVVDANIPLAYSIGLDVWAEGENLAEEFVWTAIDERNKGGNPLSQADLENWAEKPLDLEVKHLPKMVKKQLGIEVDEKICGKALQVAGHEGRNALNFTQFFRVMNEVRSFAYSEDEDAGFDKEQVSEFTDSFDRHLNSF